MSHFLLPAEPRIADAPRQRELTQRHLLPALDAIHALMFELRAQLDAELRLRQPIKLGKPYPLGQCLEISLAAQRRLSQLRAADLLQPLAADGLAALRSFERAGGVLRRVWGDLRGEFFQNAFQLGSLYLDVSNDTVTPTKPKVEILPFEQARLTPIRDHRHFAELARRYWRHEVHPNHVLPDVAPQAPLIHLRPDGLMEFHSSNRYMVALAVQGGYEACESVLAEAPMPQALFDQARQALMAAGMTGLPATPEAGRRECLQRVRLWRQQRHHRSEAQMRRVNDAIQAANHRLAAQARAALHPAARPAPQRASQPGPRRSPRPSESSAPHPSNSASMNPPQTVRLDHLTYELDQLSPTVRAQIESVRYLEQELTRLHAQIAALQTARDTGLQALRAALARETPLQETQDAQRDVPRDAQAVMRP